MRTEGGGGGESAGAGRSRVRSRCGSGFSCDQATVGNEPSYAGQTDDGSALIDASESVVAIPAEVDRAVAATVGSFGAVSDLVRGNLWGPESKVG